jgi:hypothetical protein
LTGAFDRARGCSWLLDMLAEMGAWRVRTGGPLALATPVCSPSPTGVHARPPPCHHPPPQLIYAISWVHLDDCTPSSSGSSGGAAASSSGGARSEAELRAAFDAGRARLAHLVELLQSPPPPLSQGVVDLSLAQLPASPGRSNMTEEGFLGAIARAKEYILVGWPLSGVEGRAWGSQAWLVRQQRAGGAGACEAGPHEPCHLL